MMLNSIDDVLHAIHLFFEHLTPAADVTNVHNQMSSLADLHDQISNYAESHVILPDDVVTITDAFTQHGTTISGTLALHLAEMTHHGSTINDVETGRNAARNALNFVNDYTKVHNMTFGGESYSSDDGVCTPLSASDQLRFEGGLWPTLPILETQVKGDCFAQMLEKMAQLYYGDTWGVHNSLQNHLADQIQEYAREHNPGFFKRTFFFEEDWGRLGASDPLSHLRAFEINPAKATDILRVLGIDSHWSEFNHHTLVTELNAHKPVGVLLDAQYLPGYSSEYAPHAVLLTGTYNNAQGQLLYYGIDTNFPQVCIWSADEIEKAVNANIQSEPDNPYVGKVLLLDRPVRSWPYIMP